MDIREFKETVCAFVHSLYSTGSLWEEWQIIK